MTNRKPTAISRLKQDYIRLKKDPVPYIQAEPLPSNMLEWHYVVKGPEESPYYGGYYHGTLLFPREFPFKPPSIYMFTPNGRFKTNTRLCLSISDFHPDTWNPAWSVATILTGLLSFMLETTPTLGSTDTTNHEKEQYAKNSLQFNIRNVTFRELFPDICDEIHGRLTTILQLKQQQLQQQLQLKQNVDDVQAINLGAANATAGTSNDSNTKRIANGEILLNNLNMNLQQLKTSTNINNDLLKIVDGNTGAKVLGGFGGLKDKKNYYNNNNYEANNNNIGDNNQNSNNTTDNNWQSICSNLIVLIGFAIFALIVNYVLKNINSD